MVKKVDLLLVHPSTTGVYHKKQLESNYPAIEPPNLAAMTAQYVRNKGFNVGILDSNAEGLSADQTVARVVEYDPRLVHIVVHGNQPSASAQLMDHVSDLCSRIKDENGNRNILLTGTHPAALPKRALQDTKADYISQGEGFLGPVNILSGMNPADIPALWRREGDAIVGPRSMEKLLTNEELGKEFRTTAWDLLPMEKYRAHDWQGLGNTPRMPYAALHTSLGCIFNCKFCCIKAPYDAGGTLPPSIRFRDPTSVVDEIEFLKTRYGVNTFKIIDEMFVLNPKHYGTIAQGLVDRKLGNDINIWAYARVDTINEGKLDLLREAGFRWLCLGIESGSKHVRDGVEKGRFGEQQIETNVRKIQNAGIYVLGNYIFGLPDDTMETMQQTLDLANHLNCERSNFYAATAYPGSDLHTCAARTSEVLQTQGMDTYRKKLAERPDDFLPIPQDWDIKRALLPEDIGGPGWIGYSQHAYQTWNLPTATLHPEQVLAFRDASLGKSYQKPEYKALLRDKLGMQSGEVEEFCRVNSLAPPRMILGHSK